MQTFTLCLDVKVWLWVDLALVDNLIMYRARKKNSKNILGFDLQAKNRQKCKISFETQKNKIYNCYVEEICNIPLCCERVTFDKHSSSE